MTVKLNKGQCLIEVFNGPEGPSLCVVNEAGGYRLAGPKLSGSKPVFQFRLRLDDLKRQLNFLEPDSRNGWTPIETCGVRQIPYSMQTLIDIITTDGTIYSGVQAGDVSLALSKPDPVKRSMFDLRPWCERWFGVVTAYRPHQSCQCARNKD